MICLELTSEELIVLGVMCDDATARIHGSLATHAPNSPAATMLVTTLEHIGTLSRKVIASASKGRSVPNGGLIIPTRR